MKKRLLLGLLVIFLLSFTACGTNAEEVAWENIVLGEVLPKPPSIKMNVLSNDNAWLSIDIVKVDKGQYEEYIQACKNIGFVIDTEEFGSSYYAYNEDGYYLSLYYNESAKELGINLESPIQFAEYTFPEFVIAAGLPIPETKLGYYNWQYEDNFYLYLGGVSSEEYEEYKGRCIEAGFTFELNDGKGFYSAKNSEGYYLSIGYKGFNTIYIEMKCPEEDNVEDSLEVENAEEETMAEDENVLVPESEEDSKTAETEGAIVEDDTSEKEENGGFWDFLYEDIAEFEFELNSDGASYTLTEYNYLSLDASEEAVIPATYEGLPVTAIKSQAFYACDKVKRVVIPESIEEIGAYAFYHCENMEEIVIPESVKQIKEYAFEGCDALTVVELPWAVNIGFRAFYECENLTDVTIGNLINGASVVDGYAFYKCYKLETATLEGVTTIDDNAFCYCEKLTTVNLSNSLCKVGGSAFEFCKSLKIINFSGTSDDWLSIDFWPWWNKDTGDYEVIMAEERTMILGSCVTCIYW